jgi:PIN domain nuclease of toxin-antitoxin system
MAGVILDASAVIAMLRQEAGSDRVSTVIGSGAMSVVNHAEVVAHYVRNGATLAEVEDMLHPLPIRLVDADRALAADAGYLIAHTHRHGLSLGDRFCLALARREKLPVWTADRHWLKIANAIGVEVVAIR